jgi:hypothetical protein
MRWLVGMALLGAAVLGAWALLSGGDPAPPPAEDRLGRFPRAEFYLERDLFLPATDPATVPASEARFLRGEDEVFGVLAGGQARAYPVGMLAYHHVVNDVVRGIPVAVTY